MIILILIVILNIIIAIIISGIMIHLGVEDDDIPGVTFLGVFFTWPIIIAAYIAYLITKAFGNLVMFVAGFLDSALSKEK